MLVDILNQSYKQLLPIDHVQHMYSNMIGHLQKITFITPIQLKLKFNFDWLNSKIGWQCANG